MIFKSSIATIFFILFLSIFINENVVGFYIDVDEKENRVIITCSESETLFLDTFKEQVKELTKRSNIRITSLRIDKCDFNFPIHELIRVLEPKFNLDITYIREVILKEMLIRTEIFNPIILDKYFYKIKLEIYHPLGELSIYTLRTFQYDSLSLSIKSQINLADSTIFQSLRYFYVHFEFKFKAEKDCHTLIYNLFDETQKYLPEMGINNDNYETNCILRENTFSKMIALEKLNISKLGVSNVDDKTFSNLTNMTELHLEQNKLNNFSLDYLPSHLQVLDLSRNNISSISSIDSNLTNLKVLHLADNKLNNFSLDYLPSHLQVLDLSRNNISSIYLTKSLDNLIELDLRFNKLETFTLDLENQLVNLEKLQLAHNPLKHLDFKSPDVLKLKILDLENVSINNTEFWFWAHQHKNTTVTNLTGTYPTCICDLEEKLKLKFNNYDAFENYFKNIECRVPLSEFGLTTLGEFTCHTHKCNVYTTHRIEDLENLNIVYNCSNIETMELKTIVWLIEQNMIKNIRGNYFPIVHFLFDDISEIRSFPLISYFKFRNNQKVHISASNSRFKEMGPEIIPFNESLVELNLENNLIQEIDVDVLHKFAVMGTKLKLSGNPIICDCSKLKLYQKILCIQYFILDFDKMTCSDGTSFDPNRDLCISLWTVLSYIALAILLLVTIVLGFYLKYTLEVKVYVYSRGWFPKYFRPESDTAVYNYDAFLSFAEEDGKFVLQILKLLEEDQNPPFKVCYHHRDWKIGEQIDSQIIESVEESRKTIIVLSRHFLASHWANMEFTTAHYKMLEEKSPKILLILHGDIETANLRPELKSYIKTTTYLKSDDKWFEKKLLYALRRPQAVKTNEIEFK
uniref:CSON010438 protein n=1 Tax=Culicoides sonorensis TaxID=179676 RepID=A0A336MDU2_CULSO